MILRLDSRIGKAIAQNIQWNRILRFLPLFKSSPMLQLLSMDKNVSCS